MILPLCWISLIIDGDQLFKGVKELIAEHLNDLAEEVIVPTFPRSSGTHGAGRLGGGAEAVERALEGDRFLRSVRGVWEDHIGSMRKLKAILKYMVSYNSRKMTDCRIKYMLWPVFR